MQNEQLWLKRKAWRLTHPLPRWVHAVSVASSQRPPSTGSTVQTVMKNKHMNSSTHARIFVVCLCENTAFVLYLVHHFLSFSFQLRFHLKVFFCKWHNKQVFKKIDLVLQLFFQDNHVYLNTRCRNGTYLPFPLYLWSALLYRWWPVWVVANWQIIPIIRLHFQKGLTTASGWG